MAKSIAFAVDASRLSRFVTSLDLGYRPGAPRTRGAPFADENIMCLHSMFSGCEGYLVGHALIVDSFCPSKDVTNLERAGMHRPRGRKTLPFAGPKQPAASARSERARL